jgi:hypothetical protein
LKAASHGAAERATDADVRLARGFRTKHRVKGDQLENVNRLEAELRGDPDYCFIADETEMFLPQMEQRHCRAPLMIVRISRDRRIHFPL